MVANCINGQNPCQKIKSNGACQLIVALYRNKNVHKFTSRTNVNIVTINVIPITILARSANFGIAERTMFLKDEFDSVLHRELNIRLRQTV